MSFFDDEPAPYHDVAQICLNGHVINDSSQSSAAFNKKFCDKCGEPTITSCQSCKQPIQGRYQSNVIAFGYVMSAPTFCDKCGKPFPWTDRRLAAAKEIADELEGLSHDDREKLKGTLEDLMRDSPKTEPAKLKFKNVMRKAGAGSLEVMKSAVSDIISETVKKSLFGS